MIDQRSLFSVSFTFGIVYFPQAILPVDQIKSAKSHVNGTAPHRIPHLPNTVFLCHWFSRINESILRMEHESAND
jgi:hypothetical protein